MMRSGVICLAFVACGQALKQEVPDVDVPDMHARVMANNSKIRKMVDEMDGVRMREALNEQLRNNQTYTADEELVLTEALKTVFKDDEAAIDRAIADPSSDYLDRIINKAKRDGIAPAKLKKALAVQEMRQQIDQGDVKAMRELMQAKREETKRFNARNERRSIESFIEESRRNTEQAARRARKDADEKQREVMLRELADQQERDNEILRRQLKFKKAEEAEQRRKEVSDGHWRLEVAMNASNPIMIHDAIQNNDELHRPMSDKERADAMAKKSKLMHEYFQMELETDDQTEIQGAITRFHQTGVEMSQDEMTQLLKKKRQFAGREGVMPEWLSNDTEAVVRGFGVLVEGDDTREVTDTAFSK